MLLFVLGYLCTFRARSQFLVFQCSKSRKTNSLPVETKLTGSDVRERHLDFNRLCRSTLARPNNSASIEEKNQQNWQILPEMDLLWEMWDPRSAQDSPFRVHESSNCQVFTNFSRSIWLSFLIIPFSDMNLSLNSPPWSKDWMSHDVEASVIRRQSYPLKISRSRYQAEPKLESSANPLGVEVLTELTVIF